MSKKAAYHTKHHPPHFYVIFAAVMVIIGIAGTIVVSKVVGQTTNQVIYACAQKQTGNLRMVTSGSTCRPDETAVSWNVQGPQGEPGTTSSNGIPFYCTRNCFIGSNLADKFAGKDFSNAQLLNTHFASDSDLSGVIFKGGFLQSVDFYNTNLTGADFSNIKDENDTNWHLTVSYVAFNGANLTNANFSNSQFSNSNFTDTNLQNTNFSNTIFTNDNFNGAQNMSTSNLTSITWSNVTCPDGTNSNNDGNTCVGHF